MLKSGGDTCGVVKPPTDTPATVGGVAKVPCPTGALEPGATPDTTAVEFHLGYGDWIRLLRRSGFDVIDLIEIQPPEGATLAVEFLVTNKVRRPQGCVVLA